MSLEPVVLNFTEANYREPANNPTRYWPIDKYPTEKLDPIERAASDYHYLRVPLLGQHNPGESSCCKALTCTGRREYKPGKGGPEQWCGRAAASMAYNFHQLLEGGDPRERYITHWNGDESDWAIDLRLPNKHRAYHVDPDKDLAIHKKGAAPRKLTDDPAYGYASKRMFGFPTADHAKRLARAAAVAADEDLIAEELKAVLASIRAGHPVIAKTRLSTTGYRQHIVLFCGYFWIPDAETPDGSLWLLVADPASAKGFLTKTAVPGTDTRAWKRADCYYDLIKGSWTHAKASLYLMRAAFLFKRYGDAVKLVGKKTNASDANRLVCDSSDGWGGVAYCSDKAIAAFPEGLVASKRDYKPADYRFVCMPFARGNASLGPVESYHTNETGHGGYYPVGLRRNLHSGVHLTPPLAPPREPKEGEQPEPPRPAWPAKVHCAAPGYIVAARLPGYEVKGHELVGNHLGFILVRHEFQEVAEGEEDPPKHALYTLYSHLAPPGWEALEGDRYAELGWFQKLNGMSHGQVVTANSPNYAPGECLWSACALQGSEAQGQIEVLERGGKVAQVDLGTGSNVAVVRPAPADVTKALAGLRNGDVVTFSRAVLPVEAGEALGFVEPFPGFQDCPSGFLHFELFAPADKGIKELLELAAGDPLNLGFSDPLEATEPENLYDEPTLTEKLKALLPEAERDPVCGASEEEGLFRIWNFERQLLKLSQRRSVYAFAAQGADDADWAGRDESEPLTVEEATAEVIAERGGAPAPAPTPGELTYPVTLELENVAGAGWDPSAEPVRVRVRFEPEGLAGQEGVLTLDQGGELWTLTIQVPASATKVHLHAEGFYLDAQLEPPKAIEHQKRALETLVPHRWRNVLLRRKPDMSLAALEAAIAARYEYPAELEPYYRALAWWAPGDAPAEGQPCEVKGCDDTSLFSGGEQLPDGEGALDYLHPVSGLWLLNTLIVAGKIRLVSGWDPVEVDGAPDEPVHFGWVTGGADPGQLPYGAEVTALVVLRSYGTGEKAPKVTLVVEREGADPLEVGPLTAEGGVAAHTLRFPGWGGPWRLKIKGYEGASSEAPLPAEVTVVAPELGSVAAPERLRDGRLVWRIPSGAPVPEQLECWLGARTAVVATSGEEPQQPPSWEDGCYTSPVRATRAPLEGRTAHGLRYDETGEFVVGAVRGQDPLLPDPQGRSKDNHFNWSEFARRGAQKLGLKLARLANAIRHEWGKPVRVTSVAPDGLSIQVKPSQATDQAAFATKAEDVLGALIEADPAQWDGATVEDTGSEVRLTVPPPPPAPGVLVVEADPRALLARLSEETRSLEPGQALAVAFGLLIPNGGWLGYDYGEELGSVVVERSSEDLKSAAGDEMVACWSDSPDTFLVDGGFGEISFRMGRSSERITISVELRGGTHQEWVNAAPKVFVGGADRGGAVQPTRVDDGDGQAGGVVAVVATSVLRSQLSKRKVTVEAKTTAAKVTLAGAEVEVTPASVEVDATPRLEEPEVLDQAEDAAVVRFVCQAPFVPIDKGVKLRIKKGGQEIPALGAAAVFLNPNLNASKKPIAASGTPDASGRIEARIDRDFFASHFDDGSATFDVEFYRPSEWGAPSLSASCSGVLDTGLEASVGPSALDLEDTA